jgi:hypothetical protein
MVKKLSTGTKYKVEGETRLGHATALSLKSKSTIICQTPINTAYAKNKMNFLELKINII